MSLIVGVTPERFDFRIANMLHYMDADGAHFAFGEATLQEAANAAYVIREFERGLGFAPGGDWTPVGPPINDPETINYSIETSISITLAGHTMDYHCYTRDGVTGGWLHRWDGNLACVADHPQQYADLCEALISWLKENFNVEPQVQTPE